MLYFNANNVAIIGEIANFSTYFPNMDRNYIIKSIEMIKRTILDLLDTIEVGLIDENEFHFKLQELVSFYCCGACPMI